MPAASYRDILTPELRGDPRAQAQPTSMRRVFTHAFYEVHLCAYEGGLVTCLVTFKREGLRVMFKLWNDPSPDLGAALEILEKADRGPLHLVRDAKYWAGLPFTPDDRAALRMASIEIAARPTLF